MLIVLIHNDGTGTNEVGNYTYEVRVNHEVLTRGEIRNFCRSHGWRSLLGKVVGKHDWLKHYMTKKEGICSLCGQSGIIHTEAARTEAGTRTGRANFCICPNGQAKRASGLDISDYENYENYEN